MAFLFDGNVLIVEVKPGLRRRAVVYENLVQLLGRYVEQNVLCKKEKKRKKKFCLHGSLVC